MATLPHDTDTLKAHFTLRVLGGAGRPSACNNANYEARLSSAVNGYIAEQGFDTLAARYAYNLANAMKYFPSSRKMNLQWWFV